MEKLHITNWQAEGRNCKKTMAFEEKGSAVPLS